MSITSPLTINDCQDHFNVKKLKHIKDLEDFKKDIRLFYKFRKSFILCNKQEGYKELLYAYATLNYLPKQAECLWTKCQLVARL